VPTRNLNKLAALPMIGHISADVSVRKCDEFTVGRSGADVAFSQSGLSGLGVTVAVLDSGIAPHRDLTDWPNSNRTRILARQSFLSTQSQFLDSCGHGTHVAGIMAGNGWDSTGSRYTRTFYGIARRCSLLDLRVLDT